ncbi:MAG: hypothetical protein M1830_006812 [Pleopsidium flavum]|nr:MAG: hypothetical protein M1830_006812 [Pleopsidium flavum]
MTYQQSPAYAASQQNYGYPAAEYYPQVVIGPTPTNYYQQQNYAAYQAQSHHSIPGGLHQEQHPQRYQPPTFHNTTALPPTPISVTHEGQMSNKMERKSVDSSRPPVEYQLLLLSLAEDYLNAAHGQGSLVALAQCEMEMERYYKLVATGLGCLETVLRHWRLQPRLEATVRLRYASILHEETDNDMEAETMLSTGVGVFGLV